MHKVANQHRDEYAIVCTDGTMITDGETFRIVSANINSIKEPATNVQEDEYVVIRKGDIVVRDMNMASVQHMLKSMSPQSMLKMLSASDRHEDVYNSTYERVIATMLVHCLMGIKKNIKKGQPMEVEAIIDVVSSFNIGGAVNRD